VILDGSVSSFVTESLKRCGQSGTFNIMPACPHEICIVQRLGRTLFKPSLYILKRQIGPYAAIIKF
jgi:hypothetical protein